MSSATSSAEDALKREARNTRTASAESAALVTRAAELLSAVRHLLHLLGRCIATMSAAAAACDAASLSLAAGQGTAAGPQGTSDPAAQPETKVAVTAAASAGLSAGDIAALTGLPLPDVQHLLGTATGSATGSSTGAGSRAGAFQNPHLKPSPSSVASALTRVDGLVSVLEATLLPGAAQPGSTGVARSSQQASSVSGPKSQDVKQRLLAWDPSNAELLVQHMEKEVAAAESQLV